MDAYYISIISGDAPKTFLLDVIKVTTSEKFCGRINESLLIGHKLFAIDNIERIFNHCLKCKTYKIDTLPNGSITISFTVSIKLSDIAFDDTLAVECQAVAQTLQDKIIVKLQCQVQKLQSKADSLEHRFNPAAEDYDGDNMFYAYMLSEINPSAASTLVASMRGLHDRTFDEALDRRFEELAERNAAHMPESTFAPRVNISPFASIIEKTQSHLDAKNSQGCSQDGAASSSSAAPTVAAKKDDEKKPEPNQH